MTKPANLDEDFKGVPISPPNEQSNYKIGIAKSHFKQKYDQNPEFFVRVPGRVNLIGEHIDYCGYSVCPMAIEQDVLLAIRTSPDNKTLRLTNTDPGYMDYSTQDIAKISDYPLDKNDGSGPAWFKYFLCGIKGALEIIPSETVPPGIDVVVSGNIFPGAGLSSSSALVSAALLALVHVSKVKFSKERLADACAKAERYIGTQGGGMDQAIAFLAEAGTAKHIEFNPLRATNITLPSNGAFVIAHSLADHNKASTHDFNLRVIECRLSARVIAKKRKKDWRAVEKLADVQRILDKTLDEMAKIASSDLHVEPYTLEEVSEILEVDPDLLKSASGIYFEIDQKLLLRQRALHVFQEAQRVLDFQSVCQEKNLDANGRLKELGDLMNRSHQSLQTLYECSHPEVDRLVDLFRKNGALGARLTGAGWGGCVVALASHDRVDDLLEAVKASFYTVKNVQGEADLSRFIFKTEPKQGAEIYIEDYV